MSPRTCEICLDRPAVFICQNCGKAICPSCCREGLCKTCQVATPVDGRVASGLPRLLLISGVPVIIIGIVLIIVGSLIGGNTSGTCIVWPFPLILSCGVGSSTSGFSTGIVLVVLLGFAVVVFLSLLGFLRERAPQ